MRSIQKIYIVVIATLLLGVALGFTAMGKSADNRPDTGAGEGYSAIHSPFLCI